MTAVVDKGNVVNASQWCRKYPWECQKAELN